MSKIGKAVWMSFDLGVTGDYESLYRWLDGHDARECGENLAFFNYEQKGVLESDIKASLKKALQIDSRTRIYLIHLDKDKRMKGKFLFGQRKAAPWAGYAPKETAEDEEYGG
jgi:hypothetical protein